MEMRASERDNEGAGRQACLKNGYAIEPPHGDDLREGMSHAKT